MRDDFSGSSLNTSVWDIGTWWLGRTQLGFTPQVTNGMARLRLDTFNPSMPGSSFRGSEIWTRTQYTRGTDGLEMEARVRVNNIPSGLVTSFFTYGARTNFNPPLADEIDFEHVSKTHNAAPAGSKPILLTTWNDFRTDGSNFWDPNVHNSQSVVVPGLDLTQFQTYRMRWLGNRVEWYVNGRLVRSTSQAVATDPMNVRLNFWAAGADWPAAYEAALVPATSSATNTSYLYDVDFVAIRTAYKPVSATGTNRVFTDRFKNASVSNSDSTTGFWTQRNTGGGSVTEASGSPLRLTASGAGFPHAQVASGVRSEFNFFTAPLRLTADGIDLQSSSNSHGKSILRFVLSSQSPGTGNDSEYTAEDVLSLRLQGDQRITLGYKLDQTNTNSEFSNLLLNTTVSGPVRRFVMTFSPLAYSLSVEHETSLTDGTRTTSNFSGTLNIPLSQWKLLSAGAATGASSLILQSQLNDATASETMTASVDSLAIDAVKSRWNVNSGGTWSASGGGSANWSADGVPNFSGANALFPAVITSPRSITIDGTVTAGVVQFDSPQSYTITNGTLKLGSPANVAQLTVSSGSHSIGTPIMTMNDLSVSIAGGSSLSAGAIVGETVLTKTGTGSLTMTSFDVAGISVTAGQVRMTGVAVSRTEGMALTAGTILDMGTTDLLIDYTGASPIAQVLGYLASGQLTAQTDLLGLPTTLAISEASDLGFADFRGLSVDDSAVLVKFTYVGDANLDGQVDALDYERVDLAIGNSGVMGTGAGDLNNDQRVDALDYEQIDLNIGNGVGGDGSGGLATLLGGPAGQMATVFIPEPTGAVAGLLGAGAMARRRRNRDS